jgi:glucose/arabinose dehydrogenase
MSCGFRLQAEVGPAGKQPSACPSTSLRASRATSMDEGGSYKRYIKHMSLTRLRAIAVLISVTVVTGYGSQSSPSNRPWPPGVQNVSNESPVLPPSEAVKTFFMPPGYHVELVASEPLIHDPTVIDWDLDGRLWVVEMTGFVRDLQTPEPNLDPIGNVVVLEDTNRDGAMDKRTVFADRLILPRALKVLDSGVLIGEPGSLWFMRDTNDDLKADTKELVTNAYGLLKGSVEGNANSLLWGLDNWMHTSDSDVYVRFKDRKFEVRNTPSRGEWGATQDDAGRIYRNTSESALHIDLVPTPYFGRNPTLVRTRGSYESLEGPDGELNTVWPVRPNPGTNRAYQTGIDRADGTLARFTAGCAPMVYRGDRLPAEIYGNVFVADPAANLVSRIIVNDDGTTLRARKAYDNAEFLASTDERFRPVYISNAPDGALYVVDMYRGVIQDRASTTMYLRDHIIARKLDAPVGLGRIYRVVHETTKLDTGNPFASASPAQLVEALSHPKDGVATPPSACLSNVAHHQSYPRSSNSPAARPTSELGCTHSGPSMGSTISSRLWSAKRWRTCRVTCVCQRCASPSGGLVSQITRPRPRC